MIKKQAGKFTLFQSEIMNRFSEIDHFFSSRNSGIEQLEPLAQEMRLDRYSIILPHQTHSDNIVRITKGNSTTQFMNTDALITNEKGIVLIVKTADCVPILLFDREKGAIAAVHSGWRGTSKNIIGKTVLRMALEFGCSPTDMIAGIGPCISTPNYEVGREVIDSFRIIFDDLTSIIDLTFQNQEKGKLNLTETNRQLLLGEGIKTENIDVSNHCTFSDSSLFFSARRDGAKTGRMINGIVLK